MPVTGYQECGGARPSSNCGEGCCKEEWSSTRVGWHVATQAFPRTVSVGAIADLKIQPRVIEPVDSGDDERCKTDLAAGFHKETWQIELVCKSERY